jgi:hypothetical protein
MNPRNEAGVASVIVGLAAFPLLFVCMLGLPVGALAIVLGFIGVRRPNPTLAVVGLILGSVAVALGVGFIALPDS